jgi:hypothetical protein
MFSVSKIRNAIAPAMRQLLSTQKYRIVFFVANNSLATVAVGRLHYPHCGRDNKSNGQISVGIRSRS